MLIECAMLPFSDIYEINLVMNETLKHTATLISNHQIVSKLQDLPQNRNAF